MGGWVGGLAGGVGMGGKVRDVNDINGYRLMSESGRKIISSNRDSDSGSSGSQLTLLFF